MGFMLCVDEVSTVHTYLVVYSDLEDLRFTEIYNFLAFCLCRRVTSCLLLSNKASVCLIYYRKGFSAFTYFYEFFLSPPYTPLASGLTSEVWSGVDVTPSDVREHGICCACGIGVDSGLMVFCQFCEHWQHGVSLIFLIYFCSF
jgi:hypothetical protein